LLKRTSSWRVASASAFLFFAALCFLAGWYGTSRPYSGIEGETPTPQLRFSSEPGVASESLAFGVPEVYHDGAYYPICGHHFWDNHRGAAIFCQALGFTSGAKVATRRAYSVDAMPVGNCEEAPSLTKCLYKDGVSAWGDLDYDGGRCNAGREIGVKVACIEFLHTATCLTGHIEDKNTIESSLELCAQTCLETHGCGNIGYEASTGGCAMYTECPVDDAQTYPGYNSYKVNHA
jgi:hypothetical protein